MPISKYVHEFKSADGKPVFVVRTPNPEFAGKRLGVTFIDGEAKFAAKTDDLARRFDEEFGYEVTLPSGHKRWRLASKRAAERGQEYEFSTNVVIESVDDAEDEPEADE